MMLWDKIKTAMLEKPTQMIAENNAVMTFEEAVVYAEMFAKKIGNEKSCAILCGSEMAGSLALLACFAAEVTAIPLSVRYGQAHSDKIIEAIDPTAIITDFDGELKIIRISNSEYIEPDEHPALIMCTSGTTGKPKGVMLSERNILANVFDICAYFNVTGDDTILISRPLYHCAVITGEFILSLMKGAAIRFYSEKFNPNNLLNIFADKGVTVFCGTPTMIELMARYKKEGMSCPLRKISISGEKLSSPSANLILKKFYPAEIFYVYGLTEACPRVSYLPPYLFNRYSSTVGFPLKSVSLKIVKDDGSIANSNERGILWVKGDNVMIGYYNDLELTAKVKKDGWLCTGDIASFGPYDLLNIYGRKDNLIIRAGMNIYPEEIEEALKSDSRVREVLVYGIDKSGTSMQIGMKITGDFCNIQEVRELCQKLLPPYQIPSRFELLDEMPKNGSGKIIRSKCYD